MISIILYGRNDSYGYNLHKRAALSLNCMAEILDAPDDEIIFVDYNTPDDFPTFPEAIRDTLTDKARARLRILRVRPAHHRRFAARSHLVALEPIARNVAVRRSNPANRWILSTNTDMIFVPLAGRSLSAQVADLPDGFYHLPRFELPETLWEMLDRRDAPGTIATVGRWGERYHLNEVVTLIDPALRFDGPGDFQLMLRQDLHAIDAFDERMLLGWHVDSNIATRLALLHGPPGDLVPILRGYHCDHTRQVTPAHRPGAPQNDWRVFVTGVTTPNVPDQPSWGLAGEEVEEIRLTDDDRYRAALDLAVPSPMQKPTEINWSNGPTGYDPSHVAPFVLDALCTAPPGTRIGWLASSAVLYDRFLPAWRALGFPPPTPVIFGGGRTAQDADIADILASSDVLVFDFALLGDQAPGPQAQMLSDPPLAALAEAFRRAIDIEWDRAGRQPPRRFVTVNTVFNDAGGLVIQHLNAAVAPFSTRLRQGFALPKPPPPPEPLRAAAAVPLIEPGTIGQPVAGGIRIPLGRRGQAATRTLADLAPGSWIARVLLRPAWPVSLPGPVKLEVLRDGTPIAHRYAAVLGILPQAIDLPFSLPDDGQSLPVAIRLHTIGLATGLVSEMDVVSRP